jgi:DNA polymerase III subunit delta
VRVDELLASLGSSGAPPIVFLVGDEPFLADEAVAALREASLGAQGTAFDEDRVTAGETPVSRALSAARTLPMLAPKRFVHVRQGERWEGEGEGASEGLESLAEYIESPSPSTCVVVVARKLDMRRKHALAAKKRGCIVSCEPLEGPDLVRWVERRAKAKGHPIAHDVAEHLAALSGPELFVLDDVIERLSLYVGPQKPIDEAAVGALVTRVRLSDTWALVDAVGKRDLPRALACLADAYDPKDRGLPLLGALAWSIRQLAKLQAGLASGMSEGEAGKFAGIFQPFRAKEALGRVRSMKPGDGERWLRILAETDLALKGSRRPPEAILEEMLIRLIRKSA